MIDQHRLAYAFQDNHNTSGLRVIDLCYNAFMKAREPNPDDGGPTDWFTDTKPLMETGIEMIWKSVNPEAKDPYQEMLDQWGTQKTVELTVDELNQIIAALRCELSLHTNEEIAEKLEGKMK